MTLRDHRLTLAEDGWTLVRGTVTEAVAGDWSYRARFVNARRIDRDPREPVDLDEGGPRHHGIMDAHRLLDLIPELLGWYESSRIWLSEVAGREVICSPYHRSAMTLKVYDRPGDCHGWHLDTNPLTALLILTETGPGWGTELDLPGGHTFLENRPGDCLVMHGRVVRHQAPPIPEGALRVTIPANYYYPDDLWRPEGTDALVYGA